MTAGTVTYPDAMSNRVGREEWHVACYGDDGSDPTHEVFLVTVCASRADAEDTIRRELPIRAIGADDGIDVWAAAVHGEWSESPDPAVEATFVPSGVEAFFHLRDGEVVTFTP